MKNIFIPATLAALGMLAILLTPAVHAADQPKVPFTFAKGMQLYRNNCASCHGQWIEGTKSGPPLFHQYYVPSHHPDAAFYRAALKGVRAHHWKFGDMPAITTVTREDMDAIVPFLRWLQKEKGLYR